jgi:hypothetical protein
MPFSIHTMAWSGEYRAFVVEEFIQNGGSPIMTQPAFRIRFALGQRHPVWELPQRPLKSPRVTVWCETFKFRVWGPYFFEENDVTVMVTSDRSCATLENFLRPELDDLLDEQGAENVWFRHDGATAHTSRRSLGILREMLPGHVVSLRDFFLWDFLKDQEYQHRPRTLVRRR